VPSVNVLPAIRRALVCLALLGLALTPVASLSHGLAHQFADRGDAHKLPGGTKAVCEVCAAFAGTGHGAARVSLSVLPPAITAVPVPARIGLRPAAPITAYRERAPPTASSK